MSTTGASGITGDTYTVSDAEKFFEDNGFVLLKQVVTEQELETIIKPVYMKFINREVHVPGKDLCDMSGAQGRTPTSSQAIADQLRGGDMHIDFDQLFAKRASSADSAFLWHQDAAYWPPLKSDTAAANCWLAVSDVSKENGCLRYVPGSHLEPQLRRHRPVGKTHEESHAICTDIDESVERVVDMPAAQGDLIVHHERTLHCSYPNLSNESRHAYILNLRKAACIAEERALGFDHSHNTQLQWDAFHKWA